MAELFEERFCELGRNQKEITPITGTLRKLLCLIRGATWPSKLSRALKDIQKYWKWCSSSISHQEFHIQVVKYLMFAFLMYPGDMLLLLHTQVREDLVEEEMNT